MEKIKPEMDPPQRCRLCGKKSAVPHSLQLREDGVTLGEALEESIGIKFTLRNDFTASLPENICDPCYKFVATLLAFKKTCQNTLKVFAEEFRRTRLSSVENDIIQASMRPSSSASSASTVRIDSIKRETASPKIVPAVIPIQVIGQNPTVTVVNRKVSASTSRDTRSPSIESTGSTISPPPSPVASPEPPLESAEQKNTETHDDIPPHLEEEQEEKEADMEVNGVSKPVQNNEELPEDTNLHEVPQIVNTIPGLLDGEILVNNLSLNCEYCDRLFECRDDRYNHQTLAHETLAHAKHKNMVVTCFMCQKTFRSYNFLAVHISNVHYQGPPLDNIKENEKSAPEIVAETSPEPKNSPKRRRLTTDEEITTKPLPQLLKVKPQMRRLSTIPKKLPYECTTCNRGFETLQGLHLHFSKSHSLLKKFKK